MDERGSVHNRLVEVALYFTKLGFTAFGGPAAHIALMEEQLVKRRKWLDRQHFLDLLGAVNFIPGPNSTQMAISLGYVRAGFAGLVVAGVCFILPAVLIILPLAYLYVKFGTTPHMAGGMREVNAAVLAVVAVALLRFAKSGISDRFGVGVAIVVAIIAGLGHWRGVAALDVICLAAAAGAGAIWYGRPRGTPMLSVAPLWVMAMLFLKIGATLYGSGYLLVTYLRGNFVEGRHWLSERQLMDAISVGQVTPGPLLTTSTFVGFVLGYRPEFGGGIASGVVGALLATGAIFLPSFLLIAMMGPVLPKLRANPAARGALKGMNAAVVALIGVTLIFLAPPAMAEPGRVLSIMVAAATGIALLCFDVNATWPILAALIVGGLVYR